MHASQFQWDHIFVGFLRGKFYIDRLFAVLDRPHQVRQVHIGIRADYQIGMMHFDQLLLHSLRHTSEHADH